MKNFRRKGKKIKSCKIAAGNSVATVHLMNEKFLKKNKKIVKSKHEVEIAKLLGKSCKIAPGNSLATVHLLKEKFSKERKKIVKSKHEIKNAKLLWKSCKIDGGNSVKEK